MRILIAHEARAGGGGVESYLGALLPALIARGHEVAFLHQNPRSESGPCVLDEGLTSFSVADQGIARAVSAAAEWTPEVCFSHNMSRLDVDDALLRWPVVKMMHGYFGTCISGQKSHRYPAPQTCCRTFGPACLALYMPRRCGQLRPLRMAQQFGWARAQRGMLSRYAHIVVASRHMAAEYARHGVASARLTAVPLFPTEEAPATTRPEPKTPTVVYLGRMTPLKGGDVLIHAMSIASQRLDTPVQAVLAGDGPERARWEQLAASCALAARFPGWLTGSERTALLRSASVVAVPSLWPEPFGLVGLEAAAHGVPAVAFDAGGISEWLIDGVNGRMVDDYGSAEALGAVLADLLRDSVQMQKLGHGAACTARRLSLAVHVDAIERILTTACRQ
jgi:glycosyltransferase involved in cell wall biosynthesis